jgi:hypothetical protein
VTVAQHQAAVGPAMSPDEEAEHRAQLRDVYLADAEQAVETIEEQIAGMQETLKAKKAEVKRLKSLDEPEAGDI